MIRSDPRLVAIAVIVCVLCVTVIPCLIHGSIWQETAWLMGLSACGALWMSYMDVG